MSVRSFFGRSAERPSGAQLGWGIVGIAVVIVAALVATLIYRDPPGRTAITADLANSAGLAVGDDVRVAGLRVGSVDDIAIVDDHVEVRFTVEDSVRMGSQASLQVRLNGPVGGHYLALAPGSGGSRGSTHIPIGRTELPYDTNELLKSATAFSRGVNGDTLGDTLDEITRALGSQPDAVRSILTDSAALTSAVATRADQVDRATAFAEEYSASVASGQQSLEEFIRELGALAQELGSRQDLVIGAFTDIRRLVEFAQRPVLAFTGTIAPVFDQLDDIATSLAARAGSLDKVITTIRDSMRSLSRLAGVAAPAQAPTVPGVCVPTTETRC